MDLEFISRRSVRLSRHASVSCDQPLATDAGMDILKAGGNAADAAVAMAAALNVTLPTHTGIGGDAFCLFYDAKTHHVHGMNGSGRTSAGLTLSEVRDAGFDHVTPFPENHGLAVTVPGAAAAWVDAVETYGSDKMSMADILAPAIQIAETGYPVNHITGHFWHEGYWKLTSELNPHGCEMLIDGHVPRHGEIFTNQRLADVFKELAKNGKAGFYEGRVADAIVDAVTRNGGVMTSSDLTNHKTTFEAPLSTTYKGVRLWEIGPNSQGIIALMLLNILENTDIEKYSHNSADYIHILVEALRLSISDGLHYIGDPAKVNVPLDELLSKSRGKSRADLIDIQRSSEITEDNINIKVEGDTTYLSVVDADGNACSFINSNFHGMGTAIVPENCGFTLHDRGTGFNLIEGHANCIGPDKRAYHTIIPAMVTDTQTGDLLCCYGIMSGPNQPQAHVQVLLNMLLHGMDPQRALDQPRVMVDLHLNHSYNVNLEEGIPLSVLDDLRSRGHTATSVSGHARAMFGRGHVITRGSWWAQTENYHKDVTAAVLWTGTDGRCDGLAGGY